jgi:hypothetical protein
VQEITSLCSGSSIYHAVVDFILLHPIKSVVFDTTCAEQICQNDKNVAMAHDEGKD